MERFSRQPEGVWLFQEANRLEDRLPLSAIGCELPLSAVYERVFESNP